MKNVVFKFTILLLTLSGCRSVGIGAPLLSPELNMKNAIALIEHGRPLPAERLLDATIKECEEKKDEAGLARGYRGYAGFLQSSTLLDWKYHYEKSGFTDPTITFENRFEKSREYWNKALNLFLKNAEYAAVSNVYLNLATLEFFKFENKKLGCEYLALSLQYHEQFRKQNPEETVDLPKDYSTFSEYIEEAKKQLECE